MPLIDEELRRRALKARDAWWVVLVIDPLALPVLAVLVRAPWMTPIKLTAMGGLFGSASVASFLTGHLILGAILFELRFFCDCLDGKLARIRNLSSSRGAFLDLTMDVILISGAMAALGWHLGASGRVPLELSASCAFACLVLFWLILYDIDHPAPQAAVAEGVAPESRLNRWLRRRRLDRLPHNVEVETALLFIAPITGNTWVILIAFSVAAAYYVLASIRIFVRLFFRFSPPVV